MGGGSVGRCMAVMAAAALLAASGAAAHDHAGESGVYSPATGGPRLGHSAADVLGAMITDRRETPTKLDLLWDRYFAAASGRRVAPPPVARAGTSVVHRGGRVLTGTAAPRADVFSTGRTAGEPTMGITSDGTLFHAGIEFVNGAGARSIIQRSQDGGKTWHELDVVAPGTTADAVTLDPFMYVDKRTDRLFNVDLFGVACSAISISDDRGDSFDPAAVCNHTDHQHLFAGPAPDGADQPSGYENVVYYCSIDGGALGAYGTLTACSRSLDGGRTWRRTLTPAFTDDPSKEQGNLGIPGHCAGATGHGTVGPDGTVYLPRGYCGQPYVAISRDEGDSWERVQVADTGVSVGPGGLEEHEANVAVDAEGTVYYTWSAQDRLPYMVVSKDGGKTWGKPVLLSPPGVIEGWDPFIDVGDPGRVAVIYVGTANSPGPPFCVRATSDSACENADGSAGRPADDWNETRWTGYMAVSVDATSAQPTFHTVQIGSFEDPLTVGECGPLRCQQQYDFLDVVVGPDGTPWATFVDGCKPGGKEPECAALGSGLVTHMTGAPPLTGPLPAPGSGAPGAPAPGSTPAPRPSTCSGGRVRLTLPKSLRRATARSGDRRFKVRRRGGRLVAEGPAFGLRRGTVRVRITGRTRSGKRVRITRTARTCR